MYAGSLIWLYGMESHLFRPQKVPDLYISFSSTIFSIILLIPAVVVLLSIAISFSLHLGRSQLSTACHSRLSETFPALILDLLSATNRHAYRGSLLLIVL